jgi:Cu/Ag efflux pump CusA
MSRRKRQKTPRPPYAISTVLGLIPIAPTIFWGPMAYAIMGGFMAGTVITLIFLPALCVAWFRIKEAPFDRILNPEL